MKRRTKEAMTVFGAFVNLLEELRKRVGHEESLDGADDVAV